MTECKKHIQFACQKSGQNQPQKDIVIFVWLVVLLVACSSRRAVMPHVTVYQITADHIVTVRAVFCFHSIPRIYRKDRINCHSICISFLPPVKYESIPFSHLLITQALIKFQQRNVVLFYYCCQFLQFCLDYS